LLDLDKALSTYINVTDSHFNSWFDNIARCGVNTRQRYLVVLHGDFDWSNHLVNSLLEHHQKYKELTSVVAYGEGLSLGHDVLMNNYRHHLGTENQLVIFSDENFHADAFAALSGTLVAGGVMLWLCSTKSSRNEGELFSQRLWRHVLADDQCFVIEQGATQLPEIPILVQPCSYKQVNDTQCCTQEQFLAVQAILKVASGHRNRPLVLTADRGRGKSSALAIATAQRLMSEQEIEPQTIVITAPHVDAIKIFFSQLQVSCPTGEIKKQAFYYKKHLVKFIAVDVLLTEQPKTNLLMIDEAAAIPVYILQRLLASYHRIVFSSTQHGYEGAGRGFAVKFKRLLKEKSPNFSELHIHQPIRWADNDPLERFIFNSFLLDCTRISKLDRREDENSGELTTRQLSQTELYDDESLLKQVFAVLVTAHYQTSPSDLKLMLNNHAIRIFATYKGRQVIGVVLAIVEGKADKHQVKYVGDSVKRLKNQFTPQSLYVYSHIDNAFDFSYLRVMRIAVLDSHQQQGVGQLMLKTVKDYALKEEVDLLSTSFGATPDLLKFWQKGGYSPVRIGTSADKASGEYSTMLLLGLSKAGCVLSSDVRQTFYRQFSYLLPEQYKSICPLIVISIIQTWPNKSLLALSHFDKAVVNNFINRRSLYDNCVYSLQLWLIQTIANSHDKTLSNLAVLVSRILQKHPIEAICKQYGYTGKKQLNHVIIKLITQYR